MTIEATQLPVTVYLTKHIFNENHSLLDRIKDDLRSMNFEEIPETIFLSKGQILTLEEEGIVLGREYKIAVRDYNVSTFLLSGEELNCKTVTLKPLP